MGASVGAFVLVVFLGLLVVGVMGLVVALAVVATNSEEKTEQGATNKLLDPLVAAPAGRPHESYEVFNESLLPLNSTARVPNGMWRDD